jgi:hypothetical protein
MFSAENQNFTYNIRFAAPDGRITPPLPRLFVTPLIMDPMDAKEILSIKFYV